MDAFQGKLPPSTVENSAPGAPPPHSASPLISPAPAPLALSERERELLRPEVAALAAGIADPTLSAAYATLLEAVDAGSVPAADLGRLEVLLEMGLQTGRFRQQRGYIDAQLLYRLYGRTPRGSALSTALAGVNRALGTLEGQTIDGLSVSPKGPGEYELTVETNTCRMVIAIGTGGVSVTSVEMGV